MKRMIAVLTALIMVFTSAVALADNSSGVKLVAVAGNIERAIRLLLTLC